jgi:hypothetical protein
MLGLVRSVQIRPLVNYLSAPIKHVQRRHLMNIYPGVSWIENSYFGVGGVQNSHNHRRSIDITRHFCLLPMARSCFSTTSKANDAKVMKAHALLELPQQFTAKELKTSYYRQCKLLHPDQSKFEKEVATELFLEMTDAFTLLQSCVAKFDANARARAEAEERGEVWQGNDAEDGDVEEEDENGFLTVAADKEYRLACRLWLQADAELVEECKADPKFRMWLLGNSDGAMHWRCFLFQHGGLIPKTLRGASVAVGSGGKKIRRKRK